ncbi:N-formylglutamate deformylase [Acidocella sp.]|uniref:N-formylglutamate deformylase n=1 Tax=Acidocella sp. TaxID=50710 RepID=UPI003D04A1BA
MSLFTLRRGNARLVLSIPHAGTELPEEFAGVFASDWLARKDADWWLPDLYRFAETLDATIIAANISRSVIDLNRDPSGVSLYPGQATTGLCPTETFDGEPLYNGALPDDAEIARRRETYFTPYHAALRAEIERVHALHGRAVLYDCHSIRSHIPRLFEGELPQFNVGTNDGKSCAPALRERVERICAESGFSYVVNGRFKGGWITRHYGAPARNIHAVQMELGCRGYMHEPQPLTPENWPTPLQSPIPIQPVLEKILKGLCA